MKHHRARPDKATRRALGESLRELTTAKLRDRYWKESLRGDPDGRGETIVAVLTSRGESIGAPPAPAKEPS